MSKVTAGQEASCTVDWCLRREDLSEEVRQQLAGDQAACTRLPDGCP